MFMAYIDAQPLPFFSHGTEVDVGMLADVITTLYSGNELKHLNIMKKVAMAIAGGNLIKAGIHMGCIVKPETPSDSLSEFLSKICND